MSSILGTGLSARRQNATHDVQRVVNRHLRRVLAFTGFSIDDVVNDPIAKNQVRGYYTLACLVEKRADTLDLEDQWNPLGLR